MNRAILGCDVCCCKYNVEGTKCSKEQIKITTGDKSETAHYCGDYEE